MALLLALAAWPPSAAQAVSFSGPTNFAAGDGPDAVAVGSFNLDPNPDVAVVNSGSDNVSVFLGLANGQFVASSSPVVGDGPSGVAVGDFDGDLDSDLAVSNAGTDSVSILLGIGNGTFTAGTVLSGGDQPRSIAAADFNGDADPDLAVASAGTDNVQILLGSAGASFTGPTPYGAGDAPQSVVVGNLNGDSDPDLAVANQFSDNVSVLLGGAGGTFTGPTNLAAGDGPTGLAVGNFNGDSNPDLAVANLGSDDVSILLGSGGGSFTGAGNFAVGDGPRSVAVGNFDADLDPDLAVADGNSIIVSVLTGSVGGTFVGPANFFVGSGPQAVVAGSFNGDDKPDLAVANLSTDNFSVLLGRNEADLSITKTDSPDPVEAAGDPLTYTLTIENSGPEAATSVAVSDPLPVSEVFQSVSTSQGSCNQSAGTVSCTLGTIAVGTQATVTIMVGTTQAGTITNTASVSSAAADANMANNSNGEQTQVDPRPPPVFSGPTNFAAGDGPLSVAAGDFNGDSDPDLAVVNYFSDNVSILLGTAGGSFAAPANVGVGSHPWPVAVSEFNGDTDPDLAVANDGGASPSSVSILLGAAGGSFTGPANYGASSVNGARGIVVADFNGDADPDLAVSPNSTGQVTILPGAAGATFGSPTNVPAGGAPGGLAVGEFNGDSDPDLAVANRDTKDVSILLGSAGATFTGPTNIPLGSDAVYPGPFSVAVGDFNGDSDPDLAVPVYSRARVGILLGAAGATFTGPMNISVGGGPRSVAIGDLNGDSDPDLAVTNENTDNVSVLLGGAGGGFTSATNFNANDQPQSVAIADFNGDSDPDLAVANLASDNVSILLNGGHGTIVVKKDAVPDDPQDFSFTTSGGIGLTSFQLDDDGDNSNTLSNQRTFSGVPPGSGYSVSESVPAGWQQSTATCDDGSPPSNISLSANETVTCTFVNRHPGYARPKTAASATIRLVPAFAPCTSSNSNHGAPLASASCNPPSQSSNFLTLNASDRPAPFNVGGGSGVVDLLVFCTNGEVIPCNAEAGDQLDVKLGATLDGVRCVATSGGCSAAGAQYSGKLLAGFTLRMTDRLNGPALISPATAADAPLNWGIQCSAGACSTATGADAVIPGLVKEAKRTIWQLTQLQLLDGGSDGDLAAAPSPASGICPPACQGNGGEAVFLTQGLFVP